MPQIDFFLCREDKIILADFIFKSGCRIVVEDNYDCKVFTTISDLNKYEEYVMTNVLLFILHPETLKHPLEWGSYEKDGNTRFFLRQKYGGPTMDFYSPGMVEQRDKLIGPGFLSSHSYYYSDNVKFYPNDAYKHLFKTFSSYIKKNSTPVKLQKRTYWIGNNAIRVCRNNGYELVKIGEQNLLHLN